MYGPTSIFRLRSKSPRILLMIKTLQQAQRSELPPMYDPAPRLTLSIGSDNLPSNVPLTREEHDR